MERVLLTLEGYLDEVLALVSGVSGSEVVSLAAASGRVLAEPVRSLAAVPAFANSAMDGFALRASDLAEGAVLRVVGDIAAGSASDPEIPAGACVKIMTGAPMPADADTVVPVELTSTPGPGLVRLDAVVAPGAHVRQAGEDLAAGDVVLAAGTVLGPRALSAAAAAGCTEVSCVRRPIVGVASTGDELVAPGGHLRRGQIFESNATFLAAAVERDGGRPRVAGPVPDSVDALHAVLDAFGDCDLIVLSGGVSVGDYDVVRQTLADADSAFRHVRLQPGKPQGWARWRVGDRLVPIIALPGNPLSAGVSYELFVAPALRRMLGVAEPVWTAAIAGEAWRSPASKRQVLPVTVEVDAEGRSVVRPAHRRGSASHMVTSLAAADALAQVAENVTEVAPGDPVRIRRLA